MITSTVTGKNQITIPAAIARELEIEPGMQIEWELGDNRSVRIRPVLSRAERVKQIEGKWVHLFPPDSNPIADLIREREMEDEEID